MQPKIAVLLPVLLLFFSFDLYSESEAPATLLPAPPTITLTKDTATNSVVVTGTGGTAPFALSRNTDPDFHMGLPVPVIGGLSGVSATDSGVLNDGNTYFYQMDDLYDGAKLFSLSVSEGVPGTVITGSGVNMDTTPGANTISVNEIDVVATTSTTTSVEFTLPSGAVSGYVTIQNSTGSSEPIPFTVLNSATLLENISSVFVDGNHTVFVSDTGTGPTADKVYKVNADFTLTEVGSINEATGMGLDSSNFVYYGNAFNDAANIGNINKTNASGTNTFFGQGGCGVTASWVFGVGVDKDYLGTGARVYEWDRANNSIRLIPGGTCNSSILIPSLGGLGQRPQGAVVNNNSASPRWNNLTISTPAPQVREYSMAPTPVELKRWTALDIPITGQLGQLAITPLPFERLLIANKVGNKAVLLNQTTDKSLALDWGLVSPRAVGIDELANGHIDAIVGEQMKLKRFPMTFNVVYAQIWLESGSGVSIIQAERCWFNRAKAILLNARVNLKLRGTTVFTNPALRDLDLDTSLTYPTSGVPYNFTAEESTLLSMRSPTTSDLNIYIVKRFMDSSTGTELVNPLGRTLTQDFFTNVNDTINSGIMIAGGSVMRPAYRRLGENVIAHEIGHALMYLGAWGGPTEHDPALGPT